MKRTIHSKWESWKALSKRIGKFQARIIFSILYFIMVTPVGLLKKNADYLHLKSKPSWDDYIEMPKSLAEMKEQ